MTDASFDIGLPPEETLAYFRAKGRFALTDAWWQLWHEEHVRTFTVSKIADAAVLTRIHKSLDDMIANGGTFEMWKAGILPDLQAAVAAGTAPEAILGDRRMRVIYDTNLRMARAAGQWDRIQRSKDVAPWLMYSAVRDSRTRDLHRRWDGTILDADNPWWQTHFPPCGWNCRCGVIQLSDRDLADNGFKVADAAPDDGPATRFVRGDGVVESLPQGIDPGFAYNPGVEHLRGLSDGFRAQLDDLARVNRPAARAVLADFIESTAFDALLRAPNRGVPVMVMPDVLAMRGGSAIGILSAETFGRQLARHPLIGIAEYRELGALAEFVQVIVETAGIGLSMFRRDAVQWSYARVVPSSGDNLHVVEVAHLDDADAERMMRAGRVLFDARAPR